MDCSVVTDDASDPPALSEVVSSPPLSKMGEERELARQHLRKVKQEHAEDHRVVRRYDRMFLYILARQVALAAAERASLDELPSAGVSGRHNPDFKRWQRAYGAILGFAVPVDAENRTEKPVTRGKTRWCRFTPRTSRHACYAVLTRAWSQQLLEEDVAQVAQRAYRDLCMARVPHAIRATLLRIPSLEGASEASRFKMYVGEAFMRLRRQDPSGRRILRQIELATAVAQESATATT